MKAPCRRLSGDEEPVWKTTGPLWQKSAPNPSPTSRRHEHQLQHSEHRPLADAKPAAPYHCRYTHTCPHAESIPFLFLVSQTEWGPNSLKSRPASQGRGRAARARRAWARCSKTLEVPQDLRLGPKTPNHCSYFEGGEAPPKKTSPPQNLNRLLSRGPYTPKPSKTSKTSLLRPPPPLSTRENPLLRKLGPRSKPGAGLRLLEGVSATQVEGLGFWA